MTAVFDIETTSRITSRARIVELSYRVLSDDTFEVIASYDQLVHHDHMTIDPECQAVHGISAEECRERGCHVDAAMEHLVRDWTAHGVHTLVSHGVDIDAQILAAECVRSTGEWPFLRCRLECTKELGAIACRIPRAGSGYKWPSLAELYRCVCAPCADERAETVHRSSKDTDMCVDCYRAMCLCGRLSHP